MSTRETTSLAPTRSVALDIGGDVGAVVVYADLELEGREVEARPAGHDAPARHAAIICRGAGGDGVWAVVIDGLAAGDYSVWLGDDVPWGEVVVRGGRVTELDRRGSVIDVQGERAILTA